MAAARRDTELAIGDLVAWPTKHGTVLVWVVNLLAQSKGKVPLVELLDWAGTVVPVGSRASRLKAARWAPPEERPRWFVAMDLRAASDPAERYARVASGFRRTGFKPSPDSEHGLNAPWNDVATLAQTFERFAWSRTRAGKAEALAQKRAAVRDAAVRKRARAAARVAAKKILGRRVETWSMPPPKGAGMRGRRFVLSLTGKESHAVWFPPGVGNMSVGPTAPRSSDTPHALVGASETPYWDGLDALPSTGGGSAMPRWLHYEGADPGIFAWLARRESPLESLHFVPTTAVDLDARGARIGDLVIDTTRGARVKLVLSPEVRVTVRGDAARVRLVTPEGRRIVPRVEVVTMSIPTRFSGWSITKRGLGVANAAFAKARRALLALPKADAKKAKSILVAFVDALNELHGTKDNTLLTAEREDVAEAVEAIFATPKLTPLAEDAREWLSTRRDF